MIIIFKILAMFVVMPAAYYFVLWVPLSFVPVFEQSWMWRSVISLLCAAGVGWYTWKKMNSVPGGLASSALVGAVILGAIGFCAGFFGPMIFAPGANQGPMLGIFITGPLGFLLGGAGGFVYWMIRGKHLPPKDKTI